MFGFLTPFVAQQSADGANTNLETDAAAQGWGGAMPFFAVVQAGVTISGAMGTSPSLDTGSVPVYLVNRGNIEGSGGAGGRSAIGPNGTGSPGGGCDLGRATLYRR